MSRRHRPYLPGATFHLTTRLHRKEALFDPDVRSAAVRVLGECVRVSDVELLAYVVMPNHVHLVVRQGALPLDRFMQPFLRRLALLIHRRHAREGYVFERRYRDRPCVDPDYLRNAIVYTHLNPVRACLCAAPGEYEWSSHAAWCSSDGSAVATDPAVIRRALGLFATGPQRGAAQLRMDYLAFIAWRIAYDSWVLASANDAAVGCSPPPPPLAQGNAQWKLDLPVRDGWPPDSHAVSGEPVLGEMDEARPDLSEIAEEVIDEHAPGLDLRLIRSRWGGPVYVRARHAIVRRAAACGYRNVQIAAYLRLSANAISAVVTSDRKRVALAAR